MPDDDDDEITIYIPELLRASIHEFKSLREWWESDEDYEKHCRLIRDLLNTSKIVFFEWPPKKH